MSDLPEDIAFVLKTFQDYGIEALLMGGQACVLYGGSEFSRDIDFALHADSENLKKVKAALATLKAEVIAVPHFSESVLEDGLAVHFRCGVEPAVGLRVDVMTKMRGVDPFPVLWERRTIFSLPDSTQIAVLGIGDLVLAKKTQRDKDWPMITRLVEAHYFQNQNDLSDPKVEFWLSELRTPEVLLEVMDRFPDPTTKLQSKRPLLKLQDIDQIRQALEEEEQIERGKDREYWKPLKEQLEHIRQQRSSSQSDED